MAKDKAEEMTGSGTPKREEPKRPETPPHPPQQPQQPPPHPPQQPGQPGQAPSPGPAPAPTGPRPAGGPPVQDDRQAMQQIVQGLRMAADGFEHLGGGPHMLSPEEQHRRATAVGPAALRGGPQQEGQGNPARPFTEGQGSKRWTVDLPGAPSLIGCADSPQEAFERYKRELGILRSQATEKVTETRDEPQQHPPGHPASTARGTGVPAAPVHDNPFQKTKADRGERPEDM
jgi:hypothetical protein